MGVDSWLKEKGISIRNRASLQLHEGAGARVFTVTWTKLPKATAHFSLVQATVMGFEIVFSGEKEHHFISAILFPVFAPEGMDPHLDSFGLVWGQESMGTRVCSSGSRKSWRECSPSSLGQAGQRRLVTSTPLASIKLVPDFLGACRLQKHPSLSGHTLVVSVKRPREFQPVLTWRRSGRGPWCPLVLVLCTPVCVSVGFQFEPSLPWFSYSLDPELGPAEAQAALRWLHLSWWAGPAWGEKPGPRSRVVRPPGKHPAPPPGGG